MAIDALPTNFPFLWATTGTVTVPSGGKRLSGWTFQEKPAFDHFNWLGWGSGQGLKYLKSYLDVDHDPADGHHNVMHVKGAFWKETTTGAMRYETGIGAPSSRNCEWELGNCTTSGLWRVDGTPIDAPFGTPSHVTVASGGTIFLRIGLDFLFEDEDDASAGDQWVLNRIVNTYRREVAGDVLTCAIYKQPISGNAAPSVVQTLTMAITGGAFASQIDVVNIPVDPAFRYFLYYTVTATSNAQSSRHSALKIRASRLKIC